MSEDLDLRGIDHRHEPDPQFRAALQRRVAAIVAGTDPGSVTESRDLATIDLELTSATSVPKRNLGRFAAAIVAAAAAVVAIVVVVETRDEEATPADQPSPAVTVPPGPRSLPSTTTPPRTLPTSANHPLRLIPGTYFVDEVAGTPTPRIFATLGAGWALAPQVDGWRIAKRDDNRTYDEMVRDANKTGEELRFDAYLQHDVGVMEFSHPIAVYSDACHWEAGNHPGPLDTVDGLVAALIEQQGWAEVTAPSDISVDGYVGKAFQRTAPTDMSDCSTRNYGMRTGEPGVNSDFRSWENPDEPAGWAGEYYEPGWIETLWVLDLDGTMVVISTGVWPEPSAGADADFAADVLDSIRIERVPPTVTVAPTTPPGSVGSPLVDIRSRLVSRSDTELFVVRATEPAYWRVSGLANFDGSTWSLPERDTERAGGELADAAPTARENHQEVLIAALRGQLVPAAAEPVAVTGEGLQWSAETSTLVRTDRDLETGDRIDIVSAMPSFTADVLRGASSSQPPDPIYLTLPDGFPETVAATAAAVTDGAPTNYDAMLALQNWFQTQFRYSLDVPAGHSNSAIEAFLRQRVGYCEQFAGTFAAMARALGIPSRLAVGYTPGQLLSDRWYSVTGRNSHAWPEVWFDGLGWVPFEPTPGRGIPGAENYTGVAAAQDESISDARTPGEGAVTPPPTPTTVLSPPTTIRPAPTADAHPYLPIGARGQRGERF